MNALKVKVNKQDMNCSDIASCRKVSIPKRIIKKLFGTGHEMIVLIPGSKIQEMCIETIESSEAKHDH